MKKIITSKEQIKLVNETASFVSFTLAVDGYNRDEVISNTLTKISNYMLAGMCYEDLIKVMKTTARNVVKNLYRDNNRLKRTVEGGVVSMDAMFDSEDNKNDLHILVGNDNTPKMDILFDIKSTLNKMKKDAARLILAMQSKTLQEVSREYNMPVATVAYRYNNAKKEFARLYSEVAL